VFICGEWEYSTTLVYHFTYLHRYTAVSYHISPYEAILGMAQAIIAEYNGIEKMGHVRGKITDLVIFVNTLKSLARGSCIQEDYRV
jgi:4-hydroxybutyryl-CoA dehydratase/vinylacetyl-CoA-Delta-isomerase